MELAEVFNTQYAFPVGIVLICAVVVFAYGFKSSTPPTFSQLVHAADERKTAGKKKKLKDKKSVQNNVSSPVANDEGRKKSDNSSKVTVGKTSKQSKNVKEEAEKSPVASNKQQKKKNVSQKENVNESVLVEGKTATKDGKRSPEGKKIQPSKDATGESKNKPQEKRLLKEKNYNIQQVKTKNIADAKPKSSKSSKLKVNEEKPVDFDDGEWEQAISRKEKKSKKKDEEALMAANALNSASITPPTKQSPVTSTLHNNDSEDLPASNTDTRTQRGGISNDNSATKDEPPVNTDIGEVEKQESTTKAANASASSSASNEKPKSSKSKGKNKESSLSLQKETQENENITAVSVPPPAEETTKSKKKKKQSNAGDNKEGKTPAQPVEAPKPLAVEVEVSSGDGDLNVAHDITADTKIEPQTAVVFDELGDVWKEAKAPKKSKKKVRKDQ
ncbi:hypothetical protein R5R35_008854 [Gryllus longicercus]|uniref:Uncharacterized protein n=1 Tax=Gryllus longicercus TaxID=2509291 RepID=A0AAN9VJF5_9ORTH